MIPAEKSRWFSRWMAADAQRRIRRQFAAVRVRGLSKVASAVARSPVLFVMNHTSWWDPIVIQYLSVRVLGADAYALMDAKNLRRLPFFRKVGAFGVDLESPSDGLRSMRYAAKLLDRPGRAVWVFPQGREVPVTVRPLRFRAGSAEIARLAPSAEVIPGAVRYEFGGAPAPVMWISFGGPLARQVDRENGRAIQEAAVGEELERIDRAIASGDAAAFPSLYERKGDPVFELAQALLAWMTRPRSLP